MQHHSAATAASSRGTLLLVSLLLLPALGHPAAAQQVRTGPVSDAFLPISEFDLELDGETVPAMIYHSKGRGTILVRSDSIEAAALEFVPRTRTLELYDESALQIGEDGSVEIKLGARSSGTGNFQLVDTLPVFLIGGKKGRFVKKPPVVGPHDTAALRKALPAYDVGSKQYEPQQVYIDKLQSLSKEVELKVVFGSWCSVCSQMMPRLLAVEAKLANLPIHFDWYGIPEGFQDAESKRLGVTSLPTGIFYVDGKEVARVAGHSWSYPSMAIYNTLVGQGLLER